jgi:hypothetical protein
MDAPSKSLGLWSSYPPLLTLMAISWVRNNNNTFSAKFPKALDDLRVHIRLWRWPTNEPSLHLAAAPYVTW